jgi:glycosyltransferase involved in cell wall biosynthesis
MDHQALTSNLSATAAVRCVSVVVPIFNERDNIPLLHGELVAAFHKAPYNYEFIFVDDGSTDGSHRLLNELLDRDSHVRIIRFRGNFGQTAAIQAGIEQATGDVIVTIDGDLQNDPADIPAMIEKLAEGNDLVHGWRQFRHDALSRRLPSKIANWLIARATNVPVHDLGCTLKVMQRQIAQELKLYGDMHRFIPILAAQRGAKCLEVVTNHRPRLYGKSKYGLSRTVRVILDLLTVKYLQRYFNHPMRLFGGLAIACGGLGLAALAATIGMKIRSGTDMTGNPLLLLAVFLELAGIQLLGLGLLSEVSSRIYFEARHNRPYSIVYDSARDRPESSPTHRAA